MTNNLADRCEAASGADRELDAAIARELGWTEYSKGWFVPPGLTVHHHLSELPRYTASIDAVLTLVPEGWGFKVTRHPELVWPHHADVWTHEDADITDNGWFSGRSKTTPALALCAALRAKENQNVD